MYTTNPCTTPILTDTACELGPTVFSAMVEAVAKLICTADPAFLANIFCKERANNIRASTCRRVGYALATITSSLTAYSGCWCSLYRYDNHRQYSDDKD